MTTKPKPILSDGSQCCVEKKPIHGRIRKKATPRHSRRHEASMSPIKTRFRAPPYCSGGKEKGDLRNMWPRFEKSEAKNSHEPQIRTKLTLWKAQGRNAIHRSKKEKTRLKRASLKIPIAEKNHHSPGSGILARPQTPFGKPRNTPLSRSRADISFLP